MNEVSSSSIENTVGNGLNEITRKRFGSNAGIASLTRLSGGASQELWSFDIVHDGTSIPLILRRNPGGAIKRETAASMETEAKLISLAAEAGAKVPKVFHVLSSDENLGKGYLMERVEGESLARKILRDPEYKNARNVLAYQMGEAAAKIHQSDLSRASELRKSTVRGSLEDAENQYRRYEKEKPVIEWALCWLHENCPQTDVPATVVHGDMRNGNLIVGPEGLRAVIDWEVVHSGDPMEDLGWMCVTSWRFGEITKPAGGVGTRKDLFDGYQSVAGIRPDAERVRFWEILGTLRWHLSCVMMGKEFSEGEPSIEKAAIGRRASETEIDLLAILAPPPGYQHA